MTNGMGCDDVERIPTVSCEVGGITGNNTLSGIASSTFLFPDAEGLKYSSGDVVSISPPAKRSNFILRRTRLRSIALCGDASWPKLVGELACCTGVPGSGALTVRGDRGEIPGLETVIAAIEARGDLVVPFADWMSVGLRGDFSLLWCLRGEAEWRSD